VSIAEGEQGGEEDERLTRDEEDQGGDRVSFSDVPNRSRHEGRQSVTKINKE
jgi:hypothetical protein